MASTISFGASSIASPRSVATSRISCQFKVASPSCSPSSALVSHSHPAASRRVGVISRTSKKEEDRMYQEISQGIDKVDIWDSEAFSVAFKVLIVAVAVSVTVGIIYVGTPMITNTIGAFPVTTNP